LEVFEVLECTGTVAGGKGQEVVFAVLEIHMWVSRVIAVVFVVLMDVGSYITITVCCTPIEKTP